MLDLHMIPTNGDATLLRFADGDKEVNILIDGGNRKNACLSYLKSVGVTRIHLLIASHLDEDHIRGLRRIADEMSVDELWITDVSAFARPVAKSLYMLKCCYESMLIVDGRGIRNGNKLAVYDGYQQQIGPFFLEVLSPPKRLHDHLRDPKVMDRILSSPKGQSISRYVRDVIEKRLREENVGEDDERRREVVSQVIERFDVDVPQRGEMKGLLVDEDVDWREQDSFYESARSLFNDISIVVKITFDYHGERKTFLFPGDLTNWSLLMATHPVTIRECITKVPHHGSDIYMHVNEYTWSMLSAAALPYHWQKFPHPWHHLWEKWHYLLRHCERVPFPWPAPFVAGGPYPPRDLDSDGVYEYLAPKHALIYPYRSSFRLPRLDVRNAIIANSCQTSCNFKQGQVSISHRKGDEPCMDCYGCRERGTATVFKLS